MVLSFSPMGNKKRKYGEGSVFLRKDGRWEGRIIIGYNENGYAKTKSVTAKTKTECEERLKQLREEHGRRSEKIKPDMPFGDWMDFWYQNFSKPKIRQTTQECYENRIYNHIIPEIGKTPMNKLTQNDLQQFYARLKKGGRRRLTEFYGEGLSDRMVRSCHTTCRTALEKAVTEGLITINPAIGCRLPPKKAKEMQVLTQDEIRRFLIQANEEGYYEFFLLELTTGMRRGEILGLQWKDINFNTGELHIRRQVVKKGAQTQITKPRQSPRYERSFYHPICWMSLRCIRKPPPASGYSHHPSRKESRGIPTRYTANSKRY